MAKKKIAVNKNFMKRSRDAIEDGFASGAFKGSLLKAVMNDWKDLIETFINDEESEYIFYDIRAKNSKNKNGLFVEICFMGEIEIHKIYIDLGPKIEQFFDDEYQIKTEEGEELLLQLKRYTAKLEKKLKIDKAYFAEGKEDE